MKCKVKSHFQLLLPFSSPSLSPSFSYSSCLFLFHKNWLLFSPLFLLHYKSLYFIITRFWSYFIAFPLCFHIFFCQYYHTEQSQAGNSSSSGLFDALALVGVNQQSYLWLLLAFEPRNSWSLWSDSSEVLCRRRCAVRLSTFDVHMYPNARRQLQLCRKTEREWCEKVRDRRHTSIGREEGRNKKFSLFNSVFIVAINSINCLNASRFWNTICKVPCRRTGNFERPPCRAFVPGCWADSENVLRAALSQTWPLLKSLSLSFFVIV